MATSPKAPLEGIDFEDLPWNLNLPEEHSYVHIKTAPDTSDWTEEHYNSATDEGLIVTSIYKYSDTPLGVYPSTTSLNYGTTIWEGLKCYRDANDKPTVFRPDMNHKRFCNGCHAMALPPPSFELFMRGIQTALHANSHLIPPKGDGMKLYVRPMMLGSGQQLGLYPSPEFSLLFFVSPTGNYFKGAGGGLNLHLETKRSRAARGGVGNVKCAGNYAVALRPLLDAKKQGFHDNLFLELETYAAPGQLDKAVLQEMSAANVFFVLKTGEVVTPSLDRGTILPGVTRNSVLAIVKHFQKDLQASMAESTGNPDVAVSAVERDVTVGDVMRDATECFCTGTAAELVPIARLATGDGEEEMDVRFPHGTEKAGPVTARLLGLLRKVMYGELVVDEGWLRDPFASPEEFCKEDAGGEM